MIRGTVFSLSWWVILGIIVVLGIVSTFSYYTLSLGAGISGLALCVLMLFRPHPNVWWYDVLLFVIVAIVAIGSTAIVLISCYILFLVDLSTAVCVKMPMDRIAASIWWVLMTTSVMLWCGTKAYIWIQVRNQKSL